MKAYIDKAVCVNCWACYGEAPQIFHPGDAVMDMDAFIPPEYEDMALEAAEICPVGAIVLA